MKFDRFMAIDFGEKRIGLAIGDSENLIASPLDTILNKNMETSCEKIYNLVKEWEVNHIVIGLPRIFAEQSINKQIKNFGNKLKKKIDGTDIIFFDEKWIQWGIIVFTIVQDSGIRFRTPTNSRMLVNTPRFSL